MLAKSKRNPKRNRLRRVGRKEDIAAIFSDKDTAICATYHSAYDLNVRLQNEGIEPFDGFRSALPRPTCPEADLVLDGDTSWRAAVGRTLVMPPELGHEAYSESKSYTIRDVATDGKGIATLDLELN